MRNKEYIEREAVLSLAKDICVPTKWGTEYRHRSIDPLDVIELPAADVQPVVRGKWIKIKYRSICRDCSFRGFASWNYCPNCGRQMTTEGENG